MEGAFSSLVYEVRKRVASKLPYKAQSFAAVLGGLSAGTMIVGWGPGPGRGRGSFAGRTGEHYGLRSTF